MTSITHSQDEEAARAGAESDRAGASKWGEKAAALGDPAPSPTPTPATPTRSPPWWRRWLDLSGTMVAAEARGIQPIRPESRTDTRYRKNFMIWFAMNLEIVAFSTGTLGPGLYGMSLSASLATIGCFNIVSCAIPAYMSTFGPQLGMRQMTQARYSFGFYPVVLPAFLNVVTMVGFCTTNAILGGKTLVAVASGNMSDAVGIVIIAVVALLISFMGYRFLHAFERFVWIPVLIAFVVLVGVGGHRLDERAPVPATDAATVLSFGSLIIGYTLSWSPLASDFNTYMSPRVPSSRVFLCTFAGLYAPCAGLQMLGAAFGAAATGVPSWGAAYAEGSSAGLMSAALEPAGRFGKFMLVVLSLGIVANNAPTIYSISLNVQLIFPFLLRVPRFVFALAATAVYLPLALVGAHHFSEVLSNFLGLISYFGAIFVGIFLTEHFVIRRARFSAYDLDAWNDPSRLPWGVAALLAFACGVGIVVPSMDQVYWRGPIAKAVAGAQDFGGDVGLELGFAVTVLVYVPARVLEMRLAGR